MDYTKPVSYFQELSRFCDATIVTRRDGSVMSLHDALEDMIGCYSDAEKNGHTVMFVGNGGSASIASHMAIDFMKNGNMRTLSFNDGCMLTCLGNDLGFDHVFEKPIDMQARESDVLIAVSSSGKSQNIILAARKAVEKKCKVYTFSAFNEDNPLRKEGDVNFFVPCMPGEYGFAEIAHLALIHCALEAYISRKQTISQ